MTATQDQPRSYRYYALLMAAFVTVLLCSNLIGPGKVCRLPLPFELPLVGTALVFGAGNIFFPLSYIFGDVLTEVYGYARARRVIWAGFAAMAFATLMSWVILHLPADPDEPYNEALQPALETVFGSTWRIVVGSILAFWAGDFANSYVMAKMKVWTRGRHLWVAHDRFDPRRPGHRQPDLLSLGLRRDSGPPRRCSRSWPSTGPSRSRWRPCSRP